MSTLSFTQLFPTTALTGSAATIYTAPTTAGTLVKGLRVRFTNTNVSTANSVTLYNIPLAGSAATANAALSAVSIPANDYLDVDLPVLPAGGFIQAFASTTLEVNISQISGQIFNA